MTDSDLTGRVALVTGGSRGIGAATALRLAEAGADVAVGCGQHREAAEEIAGKITGLGRRAVVVSGDMADPDVPRRIIAETAERLGAGGHPGRQRGHRAAGRPGRRRRRGLGRRHGRQPARAVPAGPGGRAAHARAALRAHRAPVLGGRLLGGILSPQYTASKAGLIGLAHSLAASLAPHGITVNAIAPGLIATDMLTGDPRLEALERSVPVGRLGQPAEVADLIVAVAQNAYMIGQTVSVDGGRYPR